MKEKCEFQKFLKNLNKIFKNFKKFRGFVERNLLWIIIGAISSCLLSCGACCAYLCKKVLEAMQRIAMLGESRFEMNSVYIYKFLIFKIFENFLKKAYAIFLG